MADESKLERIDAILRALLADKGCPKTATEIAQATDTALATTVRNLKEMIDVGWVTKTRDYYVMGTHLISISHSWFLSLDELIKSVNKEASAYLNYEAQKKEQT